MTASALTRAHIQQVINRIEDILIPGVVVVTGTTRGQSSSFHKLCSISQSRWRFILAAYSVQYHNHVITQRELLMILVNVERSLIRSHDPLPSRIFRFPILLDDPISQEAVAEYARTVRDSAVYLPDNMDYIAKSNGVCDRQTAARSIVACPQ